MTNKVGKNYLFYRERPLVGLDISQTGIKVMSVDTSQWKVQGYGSLDLNPKELQESLYSGDPNYLTESIKELYKNHIIGKLPSNDVAIGIPTNKSFARTFTLPVNELKFVNETIETEIEQYIPFPIADLYTDYTITKNTKDTATVAMSAIQKNIVDACVLAAQNSGLRPIVVEPSIHAVSRLLQKTEDGYLSTMIVDISQANTDIAIFEGGAIQVSGGLGIGGNTFTIDIAKSLDISLKKAHKLKIVNGLNSSNQQKEIHRALDDSLQKIAIEIRKVLRYYNERVEGSGKVEQVLILGAGSNIPGLGDYFTNELIMPSRTASPWQKLNFGSLKEPDKQFKSRYISVAGLASIDVKGALE